MNGGARASYFDSIAGSWDGWEDLPLAAARLGAGLEEFGLAPDETVVDVGCGTGNLTLALLARLSAAGRIIAVDLAARMIAEARRKVRDPRVDWLVADARRLPLPDRSCDRMIFFSVWPHIDDPGEAVREAGRVLRPGGRLHIWHLASREKINAVHASVEGPIRGDLLVPAFETAALVGRNGFAVETAVDGRDRYLVTASRPAVKEPGRDLEGA